MGSKEKLSGYEDSCIRTASDYIEGATRFGSTDLKILGASHQLLNFKIKLSHTLEVNTDWVNSPGVINPGENDISTADWEWYQELVDEQAEAELANSETLNKLVASVKASPYAKISEKTRIRIHPRRLLHTYTCEICHGGGQLTCHHCHGSGDISCNNCYGSGRVNCSTCHGSGHISETRQVRDYSGHYRTETQRRTCHHCSCGKVSCYTCGGRGKLTCRTCRGTGVVMCGNCEGHGYLTRITTTSTYTIPGFHGSYPEGTPSYVHNALCKAGFANLAAYGSIEFDTVDVNEEQASALFTYRSAIPFCELSLTIAEHPSTWILYGTPPRIYDAGGILEVLLNDDFKQLEALGKGWLFANPRFYRHAQKVVAPFMASEIHEDILNANIQWLEPRAIVEKVNRAVSISYIENSLSQLRKTIRTASFWSSIKWTLGTTASSIPILVLSIVWVERSKTHWMLTTQDRIVLLPDELGLHSPWGIALLTVPFSVMMWLLATWVSKRWIKKAGGNILINWAQRQGLVVGKWTALAMLVATAAAATNFLNKWPVWINQEGQLYGFFSVIQKPLLIEPPKPVDLQPQQKEAIHHRRKNKRRH